MFPPFSKILVAELISLINSGTVLEIRPLSELFLVSKDKFFLLLIDIIIFSNSLNHFSFIQ